MSSFYIMKDYCSGQRPLPWSGLQNREVAKFGGVKEPNRVRTPPCDLQRSSKKPSKISGSSFGEKRSWLQQFLLKPPVPLTLSCSLYHRGYSSLRILEFCPLVSYHNCRFSVRIEKSPNLLGHFSQVVDIKEQILVSPIGSSQMSGSRETLPPPHTHVESHLITILKYWEGGLL